MQQQRKIKTGEFEVKSFSGRSYTIIETTTQIQTTYLSNVTSGWMNGSRQYQVKGGGPVNRLNDVEFEIFDTDEIAARV